MTPPAFAKLCVRLSAAWLFFQIVLPQLTPVPFLIGNDLADRQTGNAAGLWAALFVEALIVAVVFLAWWRAAWLGRFLVPFDSDGGMASDYLVWQRVGFMAIGGGLLSRGAMGGIALQMGHAVGVESMAMIPLDLLFGIGFLVGPKPLVGAALRVFTTNWLWIASVWWRNRLNRPD